MFKRDLFTGELVEVEGNLRGRQIIFRGKEPPCNAKSVRGAYDRPWVSDALGIANPDQAGEYNEAAKRFAGDGIHFRPDGKLECNSRDARNRAMKWLGAKDNDAGYGDFAGNHS